MEAMWDLLQITTAMLSALTCRHERRPAQGNGEDGGQIAEQARIGIRPAREEILKSAKREESDGKPQDDVADAQKDSSSSR